MTAIPHDEMIAALNRAIASFERGDRVYHIADSARLRAALVTLEAQRWQDISTAPKDKRCDFWLEYAKECGDGKPLGQSALWFDEQQFRGWYGCWSSIYIATHWRPLPPAPEGC